MAQATEATSVKFKRFDDVRLDDCTQDIIALFPDEQWDRRGNIASYQHVGQHGGACAELLDDLEDATPEEYAALRDELVSIGYTLNIL